jgi:hypothetical protein
MLLKPYVKTKCIVRRDRISLTIYSVRDGICNFGIETVIAKDCKRTFRSECDSGSWNGYTQQCYFGKGV